MLKNLSPKALIACGIAVMADLLQIAVFPLFAEGAASPLDDALDFVVASVMTALLGWHWVFLPTAVAKLVPVVDLAPFWTGAVFFVIMGKERNPQAATVSPEITIPESDVHAVVQK